MEFRGPDTVHNGNVSHTERQLYNNNNVNNINNNSNYATAVTSVTSRVQDFRWGLKNSEQVFNA